MMDRRSFLLGGALAGRHPRPTVAAIVTEYRPRSHADVIVGRILQGYYPNGVRQEPRTRIVSMYTDQVPANDMSRALASRHGFTIYPSVEEALTLGGARLAVDAVLLIGEHGNYPVNERGQKLYSRYELFERIVNVFRSSRRTAPVFCDKHLSWSWEKALSMYRWSRELRFPMMAGSSISVTVRVPELELPWAAGSSTPSRPAMAISMPMASTLWSASNAWWKGGMAGRRASRRWNGWRATRCGGGATVRGAGVRPCWRRLWRRVPA
jgi:hypothetical protein